MKSEPPAQVLEALDTLERAHEPAHLGAAYQTLLDWRRENRPALSSSPSLGASMTVFSWIIAVVCVLEVLHWVAPNGLSEFWQGAIAGAVFVLTVNVIASSLSPRHVSPPTPVPIDERIDDAIGRWRHLVPAMHELPK